MAKNKYYAVKIGKTPGIYSTWDECKIQVEGVSGAIYKSFSTLKDAEQFMLGAESQEETSEHIPEVSTSEFNVMVNERINSLNDDEVVAFVDGSYDATEEKSGFGAIIIDNNGNQNILYKAFTKNLGEEFIELRNVAAELEGVKEAVNWAIVYKKRKITVFYDYIGIGEWAKKTWKANNAITKGYVSFIEEKRNYVEIEFIKVLAHSGIEYNEAADALAKRSLLEKGYKTYNDGSIYFVGFSVDDWKSIIECIDEENIELSNGSVQKINLVISKDEKKERLVITYGGNKVVINCYSNCRSYVQGKQTVLFQKIIATAIELMKTDQKVIETLNSFHALTLSQMDVENKFEELLPDFSGMRNDKHYFNLLSAVYNTMLTGYMPDYTCIITPIFRACEYYLHRILGDKMGLPTVTSTGTNNFAYFSKISVGKYECNHGNVSILSSNQKDYLNDLYSNYNKVRHPYSHWSAEDCDTAVITEMETARDLLVEGLTLVNKYYKLF